MSWLWCWRYGISMMLSLIWRFGRFSRSVNCKRILIHEYLYGERQQTLTYIGSNIYQIKFKKVVPCINPIVFRSRVGLKIQNLGIAGPVILVVILNARKPQKKRRITGYSLGNNARKTQESSEIHRYSCSNHALKTELKRRINVVFNFWGESIYAPTNLSKNSFWLTNVTWLLSLFYSRHRPERMWLLIFERKVGASIDLLDVFHSPLSKGWFARCTLAKSWNNSFICLILTNIIIP